MLPIIVSYISGKTLPAATREKDLNHELHALQICVFKSHQASGEHQPIGDNVTHYWPITYQLDKLQNTTD